MAYPYGDDFDDVSITNPSIQRGVLAKALRRTKAGQPPQEQRQQAVTASAPMTAFRDYQCDMDVGQNIRALDM